MTGKDDHISLLPDDILLHILSFLPFTAERAWTSLLSKRWRHLWAYHPVIQFSSWQPRFEKPRPRFWRHVLRHPVPPNEEETERDLFRAVDECLKCYKAPTLQTLYIDIWSVCDCGHPSRAEANARAVARWILFAGLHSVRNLHLSIAPVKGQDDIQRSIFCCRTITLLDLTYFSIKSVPSNFQGFNFLKNLKLCCVFVSDKVLSLLLSKCPVLENLSVLGCHELVNTEVSSQSIRHLVLHEYRELGQATIDAPNLRSIKFRGSVKNLFLKSASCLLNASIQHEGAETSDQRMHDWIRTAEKIKVNHWFFQYVLLRNPPPMFNNLKDLRCNSQWVTNPMLRALISILGNCPTLEKLKVDLFRGIRSRVLFHERRDYSEVPQGDDRALLSTYVDYHIKGSIDYQEQERWGPLEQFGDFRDSSHSLKTVSVEAFLGTTNEMRLVEYLLGKGEALETLTVIDYLQRDKEEIFQLLAYIPKASPHVQINAKYW